MSISDLIKTLIELTAVLVFGAAIAFVVCGTIYVISEAIVYYPRIVLGTLFIVIYVSTIIGYLF